VPSREQRDKQLLDYLFLANDHLLQLGIDLTSAVPNLLHNLLFHLVCSYICGHIRSYGG
jgi:hypothetical protein